MNRKLKVVLSAVAVTAMMMGMSAVAFATTDTSVSKIDASESSEAVSKPTSLADTQSSETAGVSAEESEVIIEGELSSATATDGQITNPGTGVMSGSIPLGLACGVLALAGGVAAITYSSRKKK